MLSIIAAAAVAASGPAASPTLEQTYRSLGAVAAQTCQSPKTEGWALRAAGGAAVTIDVAKLKRLLGSIGLKLSGDGDYSRWSGLLQKDLGAAFASRNDCTAKVFQAMTERLPLVEATSGKRLPKPRGVVSGPQGSDIRHSSNVASDNTNGAGQQINGGSGSTNLQVGGPSATNGPAIQNLYFPVTPDQRKQAQESLIGELRELARYPERMESPAGPSMVQGHFRFRVARSLYLTLAKYDYGTIESVPMGAQLNSFEKNYYDFEMRSVAVEQVIVSRIAKDAPQKFPAAWKALYEYCLERSLGYSAEQIALDAGDPNFGITKEQQEQVFQKLRGDQEVWPYMASQAPIIDNFTDMARMLLKVYEAQLGNGQTK